jgi:glycine/D-amino acid oxidase-like deaminating enzyme
VSTPTLGFTLACASGRIIADLVQGNAPKVVMQPFRLETVH